MAGDQGPGGGGLAQSRWRAGQRYTQALAAIKASNEVRRKLVQVDREFFDGLRFPRRSASTVLMSVAPSLALPVLLVICWTVLIFS